MTRATVLRRPFVHLLALLAAAGLLASPAAAAPRAQPHRPHAAQARSCSDAHLAPAPGNLARIRAAVLCLHNRVRAQRNLPLLRENARLRRAAARHSADMVARGYFAHTAPGGATFVERILAARYATRDDGWSLGENLAWGTSALGTPAGVLGAWMASPGHRANVLQRAYREIGLGVSTGVPGDPAAGATYTADFGARR